METECTDSREAVALCNLMEYPKDLPHDFQNFDSIPGVKKDKDASRYGGSVNLADYCPYIQEFTWKANDVVVRGSQCQFRENNPSPEKNFALETYGPSSKCFNHNHQMWEERTCTQVRQWQHWGSGCYEYSCADGRIVMHINNQTFTCLYKGQEVKIQLYANDWLHIGTVVCPSCQQLCSLDPETGGPFKCKPDVVKSKASSLTTSSLVASPSPVLYHKDYLKCGSLSLNNNYLTSVILTFLLLPLSMHSQYFFCIIKTS